MKRLLGLLLILLIIMAGMSVASAEKLYVYADGKYYSSAYYSMDVPDGYSLPLPTVTDENGNKVSVTWKITWQAKGQGNPNSTSFQLVNGTKLKCTWPYGSCEVTATAKSGATIRINASGYRLATKFQFYESTYTVKEGHTQQVELQILESGYMLGPITWKVGDTSVISFVESDPRTGRPTVTALKPGSSTLKATLMNGKSATCTINVLSVRMPGDVNESGSVTLSDGEQLMWYIAGEPYTVNKINSDVNADGALDLKDVLLIFQYDAGWDVTLK